MNRIKFNKYSYKLNKYVTVVCIFIITLFSHLVYPGYEVCIGDHATYIPAMLKVLNPSLYGNDFFLSFSPLAYTFFDELIAFVINTTGGELYTVLFFISLILRFIFFSSIFKLSIYLTKDQAFSLLLVLFFCLGQIKFGSLNNYLVPRSFGIVLGLFSLTLYFGQRRLYSSIVLSTCLLFHVPSFIPFATFFYIALFTDLKNKLIKINSLFLGLIPIGFLFVLIFQGDTSGLNIFKKMSGGYYMFQKLRHPDVFLLSAPGLKVIAQYLFNYMLLGFALYKVNSYLDAHHIRYLILVLVITLAFLIVTIIAGDLFRWLFIIQVQTMRAHQMLKIVSATLFVYCTYLQIKYYPKDQIINLMLIGTTASLILLPSLSLLFLVFAILVLLLRRWSPVFNKLHYTHWLFICLCTCILLFTIFLFISGNVYSVKKMMLVLAFMVLVTFCIRALGLSVIFSPALFTLYLGAFMLVTVSAKSFAVHPKYYSNRNFMELREWIQSNTAIDTVFLTEPFTNIGEKIRMSCGRSIFATFKTIQSGTFDEKFAVEAMQRYNFVKEYMIKLAKYDPGRSSFFFNNYPRPVIPFMRKWYQQKGKSVDPDIHKILLTSPETEVFIHTIIGKYKVDYIVSEAPLLLKFPIIFKNDAYLVYDLSRCNS